MYCSLSSPEIFLLVISSLSCGMFFSVPPFVMGQQVYIRTMLSVTSIAFCVASNESDRQLDVVVKRTRCDWFCFYTLSACLLRDFLKGC